MQKVHNQLHKPCHKPSHPKSDEEMVRMYFKKGDSTMLFCKMPKLACKCLEANINRYMERHNIKLNGKFIYTR